MVNEASERSLAMLAFFIVSLSLSYATTSLTRCHGTLGSLGKHWNIRLEAYDLLHQIHNIERQFTATTWSKRWQRTLPPYMMLNVMWLF